MTFFAHRTMNNLSNQSMLLPSSAEPPQKTAQCRLRFNSKALFGSENEIVIEHDGSEYRLRITSNGKLILTK